jgi:hypothetical protein
LALSAESANGVGGTIVETGSRGLE